ncbi:MAG: HNH endonuclease [Chloroflexi bacterium]|nr:HNH endonuclease [Chloroflexota bacterium]
MARYSYEKLERIFDATDGRCHLCRRRLYLHDYGRTWEVDHSLARARGGSNSLRNLRPACVSCNRSKQARPSRSARAEYGYSRAPRSRAQRKRSAKRMAALGAGVGFAGAGPIGAIFGAAIGWLAGLRDPD